MDKSLVAKLLCILGHCCRFLCSNFQVFLAMLSVSIPNEVVLEIVGQYGKELRCPVIKVNTVCHSINKNMECLPY